MGIDEAREILGDSAVGISDDVIRDNIETATLFKDIFFSMLWDRGSVKATISDD